MSQKGAVGGEEARGAVERLLQARAATVSGAPFAKRGSEHGRKAQLSCAGAEGRPTPTKKRPRLPSAGPKRRTRT
jgi:hypothetical protein